MTVLANVYVESGDEERRNEVWKEVSKEVAKIKKTKKCEIIIAGDWNACTEHDSVFVRAGKTRKVDIEMKQYLSDMGVVDKVSEYRKKVGGTNEQFATREDKEGNLHRIDHIWASGEMKVKMASVKDTDIDSDHKMVEVLLGIEEQRQKKLPRKERRRMA